MMPQSSHDWREARRLRAWELHQQGWSQTRIAAELGVTQSAVSRWLKRVRDIGGTHALVHQSAPGKLSRLTEEQRAQIPSIIAHGAQVFGFDDSHWTITRVVIAFRQVFGVSYHPGHVSKLLKKHSPEWRSQRTAPGSPENELWDNRIDRESGDE